MLLRHSVIALVLNDANKTYFDEVCRWVMDRFPGLAQVVDHETPGVTNPSVDGPTLAVNPDVHHFLVAEGICPESDFEAWMKHNFDSLTGTRADYEAYQLDCYNGVWPVETIDITDPVIPNVLSQCISAPAGSKLVFETGSLADKFARALVARGLMGVEFVVQGGNTLFQRYDDF